MTTPAIAPDPDATLRVLEGIELKGDLNTPPDQLQAHIRHAIRQGFPQIRPDGLKPDSIALVGSGPSLTETAVELRDVMYAGAKVVTLNAAYHWCLAHNIHPTAQIVLDAKPSTARFLEPVVPRCKYFIASQCHADVWETVRGRPDVFIWHSFNPEHPEGALLDAYYGKGNWHGIVGGTTVATRALDLLRMIGYLRFDLFGIDCCWLNGQHHALDQPENAGDKRFVFQMAPTRGKESPQRFECAPWHVKQFEDFLQVIRVNGHLFHLNVHGNGLLATALRAGARVSLEEGA